MPTGERFVDSPPLCRWHHSFGLRVKEIGRVFEKVEQRGIGGSPPPPEEEERDEGREGEEGKEGEEEEGEKEGEEEEGSDRRGGGGGEGARHGHDCVGNQIRRFIVHAECARRRLAVRGIST